MHKASVIGLLVFYMKMSLVNSEFEYRVNVMNDMLSYFGWIDLRIAFYDETKIVEQCMGVTEEFQLSDLVAPNLEGRIVTNENVEQKIRHAYQFLSCKFASVLNEICEYNIGICIACQSMENDSKHSDCLKELLEMLKHEYSICMRMRGSLSCLRQLSADNTRFNTGVFKVLENFITFYENEIVVSDLAPTQKVKTVFSAEATQVASIEDKMSITVEISSEFYNSNCRPVCQEEIQSGTSRTAEIVNRVRARSKPSSMLDEIKGYLKNAIKWFLKEFDGKFGFRYDLKSKMTGLMYDPDLPLVNILNKLFANPGWTAFSHGKNIETASAGGVTKDNLDDKFVQAHNFLSCKYAVTLKRCCDYARLVWKQCNSCKNSPDLRDYIYYGQLLTTIRMSDPLVSRMQDGLSHFYQLQPHVELKREAFDILDSFKTHIFEMSRYLETYMTKMYRYLAVETDMTEMSRCPDIETDMTNISQRLNNFYQPNCSPANTIEADSFLEVHAEISLSTLIHGFKTEINRFIVSDYDEFGFPFDTTPNTS